MITSISRRSRRHPYVAAVEPTAPAQAASACSEFLTPDDAPARSWYERAKDFAAGCVLAMAMCVLEEPKRAGRMRPVIAEVVILKSLVCSLLGLALIAALLLASKPS